jgi:hypothetical protein
MLLAGMPGMQYVPSQEWLATAVQKLDPALAISCGMGAGGAGGSASSLSQEQRRQLQELMQKLQYKAGVTAASSVAPAATMASSDEELSEAAASSDVELLVTA